MFVQCLFRKDDMIFSRIEFYVEKGIINFCSILVRNDDVCVWFVIIKRRYFIRY
jgi:hypothetical protein